MLKTANVLGPADHDRRMTLDEFDQVEFEEGYLYELGRGRLVESDVSMPKHLVQVAAARDQFVLFQAANSGSIFAVAGGAECRIRIRGYDSTRHPDVAVYKHPPPSNVRAIWSLWVPVIVIEVVSLGSEIRDYVEKQEEYLAFGVREYWIIDAEKEEILVLRRHGGRWRKQTLKEADRYRPPALPGFEFDCQPVFAAARALQE